MTQLLLRIFVKPAQDPKDPAFRSAVGKLSGAVGIVCNLLLFAAKLLAGLGAGSVSVMADAMNNLSDATSSIVTLLGFKLAEQPADDDHPYGHARYEYLAGLAVAVIIIVIGFELAKTAVQKILQPSSVDFSLLTAVILLLSVGVKLWMAVFNRKAGALIQSTALQAASVDSRNDCLATAAVLLAGVLERVTSWQVDGFIGLGVALFILRSGWLLAKETISPLLGETADPQLCAQIAEFIQSSPKVLGLHDLMVHDYGPGQRFASLHVEMDQKEDPLVCHEIIDQLERDCLAQYGVHLVIHYDPVTTDDPELDRMRALVLAILHMKDERISIHDFRMVRGSAHINLIFDVAIPPELQNQKQSICQLLELTLNELGKETYHTVITFDLTPFQ